MPIKINDDFMAAETGGSVSATATCAGDCRRAVGGWPGHFSRARAITAWSSPTGYGDDDPFVTGWRRELR